jgi:hypothetical protein
MKFDCASARPGTWRLFRQFLIEKETTLTGGPERGSLESLILRRYSNLKNKKDSPNLELSTH